MACGQVIVGPGVTVVVIVQVSAISSVGSFVVVPPLRTINCTVKLPTDPEFTDKGPVVPWPAVMFAGVDWLLFMMAQVYVTVAVSALTIVAE